MDSNNFSQVEDVEQNFLQPKSNKKAQILKTNKKLILIIIGVVFLALLLISILSFHNIFKNLFNSNFKWKHCGQVHYKQNIDKTRLKRIIGGNEANEHSWPFLVSIRYRNLDNISIPSEHTCGGVLISDEYVLTTSHCVHTFLFLAEYYKLNVTNYLTLMEIYVGVDENDPIELDPDLNVFKAESFEIHEEFSNGIFVFYNDIGLIKLDRKVNLNRPEVNVICLPSNRDLEPGERLAAIGWGVIEEDFDQKKYTPKKIHQSVFRLKNNDYEACKSGFISDNWDEEMTACADGDGQVTSACFGDSGGPVMTYENNRWFVRGLVSFGHKIFSDDLKFQMCNASLPFYFTRVNKYLDWINKNSNYSLDKFQN